MQEVPICSQIVLIGHLLLTVNSSINFPIYCLGNFKKVFGHLIGRCGFNPISEDNFMHSYSEEIAMPREPSFGEDMRNKEQEVDEETTLKETEL